jgi:pimeloyl-ACP methyl ester carboxylesterase
MIKLAWYNPAMLSVEVQDLYLKPFQVENWDKGLWEFTLANQVTGLRDHLNELTLPVLVITGDHDRIVPSKDSIKLAGELPNATLEVISNAGHVPHEEQPQRFLEVVTSYLSTLQS